MKELVGIYIELKNFGFVIFDNKCWISDIFVLKSVFMGVVEGYKVVVKIMSYLENCLSVEGEVI